MKIKEDKGWLFKTLYTWFFVIPCLGLGYIAYSAAQYQKDDYLIVMFTIIMCIGFIGFLLTFQNGIIEAKLNRINKKLNEIRKRD